MNNAELFQYVINSLNEFVLAAILFLMLFSWFYIVYFANSVVKSKIYKRGDVNYKYAVLVPARNESRVISNLLESLKKQDYPKEYFDVFVIVESKDDKTCEIVKRYGYNVIVRPNIGDRCTKGYALDDAYKYLESINYKCDAFMIFDADNVMNPDYITLMNDVKNQGFQIGVGYRNFTNATANWISACSATLFSFMNQFTSKGRSRLFQKATLTGTGYYVDYQVVKDAGGWIWNGMTEDVQLTYYCYQHNVKMHYYPKAQYYDEQATSLKTLHNQHVRWVWGFFSDKTKFKENRNINYDKNHNFKRLLGISEYSISIYPFVAFIVMQVVAAIIVFGFWVASFIFCIEISMWLFFHFLLQLMWIYISFCFIAFLTICIDNHHLKFNWRTIISIIFTYAFFFGDFLFAFLDGLFHKEKRTSWKQIEHKGIIVDKQAKEANNEKK